MATIKHTDDSANVVYFSQRYPGWHSYGLDKRTERAVERARQLGAVVTNGVRQFRSSNTCPLINPGVFKATLAAKIFDPSKRTLSSPGPAIDAADNLYRHRE